MWFLEMFSVLLYGGSVVWYCLPMEVAICEINYAAFERTYSRESEQAKALGIVVDLEEKLRSMLSEEQKALFKQYDDAVADLASVSNADCFVEGYQLGVNLILAAFPEHVEELKQALVSTHKMKT